MVQWWDSEVFGLIFKAIFKIIHRIFQFFQIMKNNILMQSCKSTQQLYYYNMDVGSNLRM